MPETTAALEAKKFLTSQEAAQFTGFAEGTLRKWRAKGEGDGPKHFKVRGRVRYARADLEKFLTTSPRD